LVDADEVANELTQLISIGFDKIIEQANTLARNK
jgi:hypothetical protein